MRLYYQVPNESLFLRTACKLACNVPNFDLCDVERIPSMGKHISFLYFLTCKKLSYNVISQNHLHMLIFSTGNISHIFPLIWRFLPGMDPQVDSLFVRDLDSDISKREQEAVQEFSRSSKVLKMYPKITENDYSNFLGHKHKL